MFYEVSNPNLTTTGLKWIAGTRVTGTLPDDSTQTPQWPKLYQFKMSDHMGVYVDNESVDPDCLTTIENPYNHLTDRLAYDKIGVPTIGGLAPAASIYHATSSQTMPTENLIVDPFALEAAVIEIPVVVQRMRGEEARPGSITRFYESCRDIDNYTFFLYRQTRAEKSMRDSVEHVESSRRYLIGSGCASFYNSNAFSGRVPELVRSKGLPHTPSFSHDFLTPSGTHPGFAEVGLISAFTGTLRIEIKPGVAVNQLLGGSRFPLGERRTSGIGGTTRLMPQAGCRSIVAQDYWPGSTYNLSGTHTPVAMMQQVGPINSNTFPGTNDPQIGFAGNINSSTAYTYRAQRATGFATGMSFERFMFPDPRSLKNNPYFGPASQETVVDPSGLRTTENSTGILGYTNFPTIGLAGQKGFPIGVGSMTSSFSMPYLLLPGDDLVLGLDVGVSMLPSSGSGMQGSTAFDVGKDLGFYSASSADTEYLGTMSGSFMKILQGKAKLTLYGSLVRQGIEISGESNQNITSDAVHEAVGSSRVTDQYDISSRFDLSGSYVDRFIAGSMSPGLSRQMNGEAIGNFQNFIFRQLESTLPRRVVGIFSKDRSGMESHNLNTQFANYQIGAPPRINLSNAGDIADNEFVILDPHNISKLNSAYFHSPGIRSLQRFITLVDSENRIYDTMMPKISDFVKNSPTSLSIHPIESGSYTQQVSLSKNRNVGYPYLGNPQRMISEKYKLAVEPTEELFSRVSVPSAFFLSDVSEVLVRTCLFQRGWNFSVHQSKRSVSGHFRHPVSGAFGPVYGIKSVNPGYPVAQFRRDRFGQFRDMLEQRKDYVVFNTSQKGLGTETVSVKFVNYEDGETEVSPFDTDSYNQSKVYSASMPYNDGSTLRPTTNSEVVLSVASGPVTFNMSSHNLK